MSSEGYKDFDSTNQEIKSGLSLVNQSQLSQRKLVKNIELERLDSAEKRRRKKVFDDRVRLKNKKLAYKL